MTGQIETRKELQESNNGSARYWELEFQAADNEEKEYRKKFSELECLYRAEKDPAFNIFFSNVETLKPIIYSQPPNPDVRPKVKTTRDLLSNQTSMMLETALRYNCEEYDIDDVLTSVRDDRLIGGRGVARIVYKPIEADITEEVQSINPETNEAFISVESRKEIVDQELISFFVNKDDYKQSPARRWDEVRWVAFGHTPTREEAVEQFGEIGHRIPLNHKVLDEATRERGKGYAETEVFKRARVWEIWDKQTLKRIWFCPGFPEILKEEEDPYDLQDFFPMPKPLVGISTNGTMVPVPDFVEYEKQAKVVEQTTIRINKLTRQLQAKGLYNQVDEAVKQLIDHEGDNFMPVLGIDPSVKLNDQIVFWPIEKIAEVILSLYQARQQAVQTIFEITGMSDLVRGASDPNETATAQQIKGTFAGNRLTNFQKPMRLFIRDLMRLKAEILSEHFTPKKLAAMTNTPLETQVDQQGNITDIGVVDMLDILRNEELRNYRIDIETDSTVEIDANADKQRRIEFMGAVTEMINQVAPMVNLGIIPIEVAKELLNFGSRGFKIGRQLEDALERIGDPDPQQQQQEQQPSEEELKALNEQQKNQIEIEKLKLEQQKVELQAAQHNDEMAMKQKDAETKAIIEAETNRANLELEREKFEFEKMVTVKKLENEMEIALIQAQARVIDERNVPISEDGIDII
jgi:hypothetical protein